MADFFDDLGKRVVTVASDIGKMAEDTIEVQKMKSEIRSLKRANERDYAELGKAIYERFQNSEVVDMEFIPLCEAIERRKDEITEHKEKISKIQEEV